MSQPNNIVIKNKKASFDYEFVETYVAGMVLTGTEIKSIRLGKAGLADSYCVVIGNELWVKNMYIAEYFYGTYNNHDARKDRKLLLNRKELNKIDLLSKNTGFTVIPTKLFINVIKDNSDKSISEIVEIFNERVKSIAVISRVCERKIKEEETLKILTRKQTSMYNNIVLGGN